MSARPPLRAAALALGVLAAGVAAAQAPPPPAPGQHTPAVLRVDHRDDRVIPVRTRDFMVTVIHLSPWERIEDFYLGDGRVFDVRHDPRRPNVLRVRQTARGAETNLVAIAESGRVFTFYLREDESNAPSVTDLTVFVATESGAGGERGR